MTESVAVVSVAMLVEACEALSVAGVGECAMWEVVLGAWALCELLEAVAVVASMGKAKDIA